MSALSKLFQDTANAIRGKTGETGTMKPAEFPAKINAIEIGGSAEDVEAINNLLDEINGEVIGEALYTVTFLDEDGSLLGKMTAYEDKDCEDPIAAGIFEEPTKEGTRYYGWKFTGWSLFPGEPADSNALKNITWNKTLYAAYEEYEIFIASGYCGDTTWHQGRYMLWGLNPDYVLKITRDSSYDSQSGITTGTGSYYSSSKDGAYPPWYDYQTQITSIIVSEGVRSIGMSNFVGCTALTSVWLPSTVFQLEHDTFSDCTALTSIRFPAKMKYIQERAFKGCSALTSAIFERTTGWTIQRSNDVLATLSKEEMADPAKAAVYLTTTYGGTTYKDWCALINTEV